MIHSFLSTRAGLRNGSALPALALAGLLGVASPAFAQDVAPQTDQATAVSADGAREPDDVVVTGSRIARPDLEAAVPVAVLSAQNIADTGANNIQDVLADLPSVGQNISRTSSNFSTTGNGQATVNLRNLGVVAHPGAGQRPSLRSGAARHLDRRPQHHSDRPDQAGRRRHRRRVCGLWLGGDCGRRQLRSRRSVRRAARSRPGRRFSDEGDAARQYVSAHRRQVLRRRSRQRRALRPVRSATTACARATGPSPPPTSRTARLMRRRACSARTAASRVGRPPSPSMASTT